MRAEARGAAGASQQSTELAAVALPAKAPPVVKPAVAAHTAPAVVLKAQPVVPKQFHVGTPLAARSGRNDGPIYDWGDSFPDGLHASDEETEVTTAAIGVQFDETASTAVGPSASQVG